MESLKRAKNLTEIAYDQIKDMVIRGEIPPGEVVSITYLSDMLEIGRTPTSNACQKLESDGLLKIIPKQGILINSLTIDDARDLYESRSAIEIFASQKSFEKLDREDISILEELISKQIEAGKASDAYEFMKFDTKFHKHLLNKHENKLLLELFFQLSDRILIFGIRNASINQRLQRAIEEHKVLLQYIKSKNKELFIKGLEQHIMNGYITLTGNLEYKELIFKPLEADKAE